MNELFEKLTWLPRVPCDFLDRLNKIDSENELLALSNYALDDIQLNHIAKSFIKMKSSSVEFQKLQPMVLGVISNGTTSFLESALTGTALRHGIGLDVIEAKFNQIAQLALSSEPIFNGTKVDAILLAIDYRGIPLQSSLGSSEAESNTVNRSYDYILNIVDSLQVKTGAKIILQNIVPPCDSISGSFERRLTGTITSIINKINARLDGLVKDNLYVLDVNSLAINVGLSNWHDPKYWNIAKLSFAVVTADAIMTH